MKRLEERLGSGTEACVEHLGHHHRRGRVVGHEGLEFGPGETSRLGSLESHHGRRPTRALTDQRLFSESLTGAKDVKGDDVSRWGGDSNRHRTYLDEVHTVSGLTLVEDEPTSREALAGTPSKERTLVGFG